MASLDDYVVSRITALKDGHALIPRIRNNVTLCGNSLFTDVIKIKDLIPN